MGWVPYGSAYKNKGHIHHYSASLFHSHTHWAMTHHTLPQRATEQVTASCTETSTKGSPPFRSHRQGFSHANTTIQAIIGLIDITDVTLAYRNSDLSTQSYNSKTLFCQCLAVVLRTKVWSSKCTCWSVLLVDQDTSAKCITQPRRFLRRISPYDTL